MTDLKEQLLKQVVTKTYFNVIQFECAKTNYENHGRVKFKPIPYAIHSIGKLSQARYKFKPCLFIKINFEITGKKDLFTVFIPFSEILKQIEFSNSKFEYQNSTDEIFCKFKEKPIQEIVDDQSFFIFHHDGKKYKIPEIELARALFYQNKDILNATFLPNALEHMRLAIENNNQLTISLYKDFYSQKNLPHLSDRLKTAWLFTNQAAKTSFLSIATDSILANENSLIFNFTPPNLKNCQMYFSGTWDAEDSNLFLVKQIKSIALPFYKINQDVLFTDLHTADNDEKSSIRAFDANENPNFSDHIFSFFFDAVNQLALLGKYKIGEISIEDISYQTIRKAEAFCYSKYIKSPKNALFNFKEKNIKKYYQAKISFKGKIVYLLAVPLRVHTASPKIRAMLLSLSDENEDDFEIIKNEILEGKFEETKIDYDFSYRFLKSNVPKREKHHIKSGEFAENLHETIKFCADYSKHLNKKEKVIDDFVTTPLNASYPIVFIESIKLPIWYNSKNQHFDFDKTNFYSQPESLHLAFGINSKGEKKLLGLWVFDSTSSTDTFWDSCFSELQARGLKKIKWAYVNSNYLEPSKVLAKLYQSAHIENRPIFAQRHEYQSHCVLPLYQAFHDALNRIHQYKSRAQVIEELKNLWVEINTKKLSTSHITKETICDFYKPLWSNASLRYSYLAVNQEIESILDEVTTEPKRYFDHYANEHLISLLYKLITTDFGHSGINTANFAQRKKSKRDIPCRFMY